MMQALFKNKIVMGAVVVLVLMVGGYFAIKSSGSRPEASGVKKQAVTQNGASDSATAAPGQEFVSQLLAIQNITLNLNLFTDPVFGSLEDFSREIAEQPISRPNPFAPIDLKAVYSESAQTAAEASVGTDASSKNTTSSAKTKAKATGEGALFEAVQ